VTRHDATREPANSAGEMFVLRFRLSLDMKAFSSKHYQNYVCTHFTFVPWPIDRTAASRRAAPRFSSCFSLLCSVKWPTNLYNLPSVEGKMTWARTCAATCPNSFNPLIVRIIFLILRQTTTISRMYRAARIEFFILLVNT